MADRVFTDKEILYAALRLFRKIDEVEFKIIRDIVSRNFGEERVYKDVIVLEDLSSEVSVSEKEAINGEVIKEFSLNLQNFQFSNESMPKMINPGTICSEPIDSALYNFLYLMSLNAEELTLRKISFDPRISFLSGFELKKRAGRLYKKGLLNGIEYVSNITAKNIEEDVNIEEFASMLNELIKMYLNDKEDVELKKRLKQFEDKGNIIAKSFELNESGIKYLNEKMSQVGIENPKDRGGRRINNPSTSSE